MSTSRQFLRTPFVLFDSTAISVIGVQGVVVYLMLMRFVFRGTHRDSRIAMHQRDGKLVAYANQGLIALTLGISRQSVCKQIGRLAKMRLLRVLRLGDNKRAYILGFKTNPKGNRTIEHFTLERKLRKAVGKVHKDLRSRWSRKALRARRKRVARELGATAKLSRSATTQLP